MNMIKLRFFTQLLTMLLVASNAIAKDAENVGMPQMSIPDFMPQLVWLCIIFPIIYLTMKYIALPRISNIITNRELKLSTDLTKAEDPSFIYAYSYYYNFLPKSYMFSVMGGAKEDKINDAFSSSIREIERVCNK